MNRSSSPWSEQSSDDASKTGLRPPQNIEAERSALGCALLDTRASELLLAELEDDDFYDPAHRAISAAMRSLTLKKKPVDTITVAEELERTDQLEAIGGRSYLLTLPDAAPILSNAEYYISIVLEKSLLRQIITTLDQVKGMAYSADEANKVLDLAAAKLFDLKTNDRSQGPQPLHRVIGQVLNEIHELQQGDDSGLRVKTGYPSLDRLIGGLKPGTLNILAARPAMGKSALAINIAQKVSVQQDLPVALFSLEMSRSEIGIRLMSAEALIDSYKLSTGDVSPDDWVGISKAVAPLYTAKLYIDDTAGASPFSILSECRRLKLEHGLSLVIIDYLQLMSPDGRHDSRQQEISEISRNLKLLAKELEVPVLALSQLSRAVEMRQNKRPLLSDLRESGSIEQDADTVMFIYRESYYQDEPEGDNETAEIIVAKNRGGKTGHVKLTWIPRHTLFIDQSRREPPPVQATSMVPDPPFDVSEDQVPNANYTDQEKTADDQEMMEDTNSSLPYD